MPNLTALLIKSALITLFGSSMGPLHTGGSAQRSKWGSVSLFPPVSQPKRPASSTLPGLQSLALQGGKINHTPPLPRSLGQLMDFMPAKVMGLSRIQSLGIGGWGRKWGKKGGGREVGGRRGWRWVMSPQTEALCSIKRPSTRRLLVEGWAGSVGPGV